MSIHIEPKEQANRLKSCIHLHKNEEIYSILKNLSNEDILETLENLNSQECAHAFKFVDKKRQATVFGDLSFLHQSYIIRVLSTNESTKLLKDLPADELHRFLQKAPRAKRLKILSLLDSVDPNLKEEWQRYSKDEVGHWMSDDYFQVDEDMNVQDVLEKLRLRESSQPLYSIMVVDSSGVLLDKLNLDEVVSKEPSTLIKDIMDRQVAYLYVDDSVELSIERFFSRDTIVMPIVDRDRRLKGVISADDVMHLAQDETTEDMMKMGGLEASSEPYLQASIFEQFKKRGGWLLILFIGEMFTATAMGFYEEEISHAVVLALFLPLILSSGGNSGSQSSTLVIRALALKEFGLGEWYKVFKREIVVGLMLGILLGSVALTRIALWEYLGWSDYTENGHFALFDITLAVSIGIVGIVAWGNLVGSLLPIGLRALRLDPATISAPFLATFVDVTGLIIYFSAAKVILGI